MQYAVSTHRIRNKAKAKKLKAEVKISHDMNFPCASFQKQYSMQYIPLICFALVVITHKKAAFVCRTMEAYAKVDSASQSSQAVPHCSSLKLLGAPLILVLPWLHLIQHL